MDFAGIAALLGVPLAILTAVFSVSGDRSRLRRLERITAIVEKLPPGDTRARAQELQSMLLVQVVEFEMPDSPLRLQRQVRWRLWVGLPLFVIGYAVAVFVILNFVLREPMLRPPLEQVLVEAGIALIAAALGLFWVVQSRRFMRKWRQAIL